MSRFYEFIQKIGTAPQQAELGSAPVPKRSSQTDADDLATLLGAERADVHRVRAAPARKSADLLTVETVGLPSGVRIVTQVDPTSPTADRYRYLRFRLQSLRKAGNLKTILVASPLPRDGKTTVALNLATTLVEKGTQSVLLIDADLHRSIATMLLGLEGKQGLSDCLEHDLDPLLSLKMVHPLGWHFLPSGGKTSANPTELLQGPRLPRIVEGLSNRFDWIVLDSPPTLPLTDACILSHHTDGTLLVLRAGQTPQEAANQAVTILGKKTLVGVVLNGADPLSKPYHGYGEYYGRRSSESGPETDSEEKRRS
jgi:capsular exopolysaccharide synthesis family protein